MKYKSVTHVQIYRLFFIKERFYQCKDPELELFQRRKCGIEPTILRSATDICYFFIFHILLYLYQSCSVFFHSVSVSFFECECEIWCTTTAGLQKTMRVNVLRRLHMWEWSWWRLPCPAVLSQSNWDSLGFTHHYIIRSACGHMA